MRLITRSTVCLSLLLGLAASRGEVSRARTPGDQQGQQNQQVPVFRSAVTLVPVDIRVVDKTGKAVTDLEQKDFTILEDGVPQQIGEFSKLSLATEPASAETKLPRRESSFGLSTQKNRIFLLLLGRGRLQEPSKGLDALIRFVRDQLLPQDQVAVLTYDRATDFTTDHEEVARLLERFRELHYGIDMEVGLQINSGLAAVYGGRALPKSLQSRIDKVFTGSGTLASHATPSGRAQGSKADEAAARATDAVQRKDVEDQARALDKLAAELGGDAHINLYSELDEIQASAFTDLTLDDFMSVSGQSLQDLGNVYAGIEYLRHLDGEKHLIYVSEKGMTLPTADEDELLAATANDARVVLDTFQTGGIYISQTGGVPVNAMSEAYAKRAMRTLAELTGGVSSVMEPGTMAMDRVDQTTRSGYVLGYYPSNAQWTGKYRKITVKVNRPDVTVFYRHGYYGRETVGSFDRRTFITRDRVTATLGFRREIKDIRVKLDAKMTKVEDRHEITASVLIDPTRLALSVVDGKHVGMLDIAVVSTDERGQPMGSTYQRAAVELTEEAYQRVRKDGIPYKVTFPTNAGARTVRVAVYDFKADLVGSADAKVW